MARIRKIKKKKIFYYLLLITNITRDLQQGASKNANKIYNKR